MKHFFYSLRTILTRLLLGVLFALFFTASLQAQVPVSKLSNEIFITAGMASAGSNTISLKMPTSAQASSIKVVLNGQDVSLRFQTIDCGVALCETATLTTLDGLLGGKNTLYAVAKTADGNSSAGVNASATIRSLPTSHLRPRSPL